MEDIIKNLSQQSVDFVLKIIGGLLVLIIGIAILLGAVIIYNLGIL